MNSTVYVLDACAMLAALNDEEGADIVRKILIACEAHTIVIHISAIQVLEVYGYTSMASGMPMSFLITSLTPTSLLTALFPIR
ncbi:hypothetical protein FACS1894200_05240 [Spirochaetia bacterium]|nr:hypothetical protein FACS1894200_05240 [Spirochaetia bacterium]